MLALLSPSKTLDFSDEPVTGKACSPALIKESEKLVKKLKKLKPADFKKLMGISDKLAELNFERYQQFATPFNLKNSKQAIKAFKGDVYDGLDAGTFADEDYNEAQNKIRIISGLYGIIRPLDLIQPYRLEMGTKLNNERGKNLYEFWDSRITDKINEEETDTIINLASNEYFKAVKPKNLKAKLINISFKENKNGEYKVIGLFAKKARGMMARHIVKNKINNPERLKKFTDGGYKFNDSLSNKSEFIFTR